MKKVRICLDPGHYEGYNRGVVTGYTEGTAMLDLAQRLKKALEEYDGAEVILTRSTGADVDLAKRGKMAKGCDVFLSLHSDAATRTAAATAKGASIVRSLQRADSVPLAKKLVAAAAGLIGSGYHYSADGVWTKAFPLTTKTDYYQVMREAVKVGCPYAFLLEHGFHTYQRDCEFLDKAANRQRLAEAEAAALAQYFGLKKKAVEPVMKVTLYSFLTGNMTNGDAVKYRAALQRLQEETGVGFTESHE